MAKRLRQSNLFDTFSKKHKESDSDEMSQQDIMENLTLRLLQPLVILRQKARRIQDTVTILNLRVMMTFKQMIVFLLVVQD